MGNTIGDKGRPGAFQMLQHISGSRSRIQIHKIFRTDQSCRIGCDLLFFFNIQLNFLGYGRLIGIDSMFQCHRTAKNPGQLPRLVKRRDVSADRRFRCIQDIFQFCYRNTVFSLRRPSMISYLCSVSIPFPPSKKTSRSTGPGCLLFTHSEITGSPA